MAAYYVSSLATGSGSGTLASPWTVQQAASAAVSGDYVWQLPGTYPLSAALTIATGSYWETYTSTPGDGLGTATWQATVAGITIATFSGQGARVRGVTADGNSLASTRGLVFSGGYQEIEGVRVTRCTSAANAGVLAFTAFGQLVDRVEVDNCSGGGSFGPLLAHSTSNPPARRVCLHGNAAVSYAASGYMTGLVAYANATTIAAVQINSGRVHHAVIAANTGNAVADPNSGNRASALSSSVLYGNSGYAVGNGTVAGPLLRWTDNLVGANALGNGASGGAIDATGTVTLTADPFVASSTGDLRLSAYGKTLPGLRAVLAGVVGAPGVTTDSLADLVGGGSLLPVGQVGRRH